MPTKLKPSSKSYDRQTKKTRKTRLDFFSFSSFSALEIPGEAPGEAQNVSSLSSFFLFF